MHQGITLLDGVERNRMFPTTFEIPSDEAKMAVQPGDFVKIGFEFSQMCERMWVEVKGAGFGELNNDPVLVPMVCGEPVHYENRHILSIVKADRKEQEALEQAHAVIDRVRSLNLTVPA